MLYWCFVMYFYAWLWLKLKMEIVRLNLYIGPLLVLNRFNSKIHILIFRWSLELKLGMQSRKRLPNVLENFESNRTRDEGEMAEKPNTGLVSARNRPSLDSGLLAASRHETTFDFSWSKPKNTFWIFWGREWRKQRPKQKISREEEFGL